MSTVAVIPARMGAVRLPGKPLLAETGKPLIQHVYENVAAAKLIDRVIIATDDERIASAVRGFGGEAAMTRADHASGTDRIAEVAAGLPAECDVVLNVQGDEPELEAASIDALVRLIRETPDCPMATLASRFSDAAQPPNPNCVKVVLDKAGRALYFSRSLIPYPRDARGAIGDASNWLLHLGIYAYDRQFLLQYAAWPPTTLERTEQLEQLRALFNGVRIAVGVVDRGAVGIDTPEDYAAFVERMKRRQSSQL